MIVTCPSCSARYKLDDSKITGRGARITCPRCRHVFVVFPSGAAKARSVEEDTARNQAVATAGAPSSGGPSLKVVTAPSSTPKRARRSAEDLDFRAVGIPSWKVKVKIGLVYDFSDIKTLRKYIQDGRVTPDDAISHDGTTWKTIGDIPDLDAHFVDIYEQAEAARAVTNPAASGFEDDSPTTIVGMGSLGRNLANEALRQATEEALADSSLPPSTGGYSSDSAPSQATAGSQKDKGDGNPFVDPFAALKDRQRERIQSRRGSRTDTGRSGKQAQANQSRLLLAGLALVVGGGVWWTLGQEETPAEPVTTVRPPVRAKVQAQHTEDYANKLREEINTTLREVEEEVKEPPAPQLIAVRPDDAPGGPASRRVVAPTTREPTQPASPTETEPASTSLASVDDHVDTAWYAIGTSDWKMAGEACRRARGLEPRAGKVLLACGAVGFHKGEYDAAERDLGDAAAAGARDSRLIKYRGLVAEALGDLSGAVGFYRDYLKTSPSDGPAIQRRIDDIAGG